MRKGALAVAGLAVILGFWIFLQAARAGGKPVVSASDYPLGDGLRWEYRGPGRLGVVRSVAGASEVGGRRFWRMSYEIPLLGTRELLMRHTAEGVVATDQGRERLLLRFPMVKGDSWTVDLPSENEAADCTVLGEEEIEFLGRTARAAKLEVRRRRRDGDAIATDYEWYAPGFGLVRMEVTLGVRATFVLRSFAPTRGGPNGG